MSATEAPQLSCQTRIANVLNLVQIDADRFRSRCHDGAPGRAYGGHLVAQSLMAAGRTVNADKPVHSLHSYFFHGANTSRDIDFTVERIRDSRRHSHRRVIAAQDGREVFSLLASFRLPDAGSDRQRTMPAAPDPERLPDSFPLRKRPPEDNWPVYDLLRMRQALPTFVDSDGSVHSHHWFRYRAEVGESPLLHAGALAYISDLTLAQTAQYDYEARRDAGLMSLSSLDHSIWFHRPFRADEWLLYAKCSTTMAQSRGLSTGEFWNRRGELVATATQETLILETHGG